MFRVACGSVDWCRDKSTARHGLDHLCDNTIFREGMHTIDRLCDDAILRERIAHSDEDTLITDSYN